MIEDTRDKVKDLYGADVIYGDTDSVMIKFKLNDYSDFKGNSRELRTAKIK